MESREEVDKTLNDEHTLMQDLFALQELWIRNQLEMVKYPGLLIEKGAKVPEDYHSVTGIFRNLWGIFPKEVAITIRR